MRRFLFVALVWLSATSMLMLENSWMYSGLAVSDRFDYYNKEGLIDKQQLRLFRFMNPGISFAVSTSAKGLIDSNGIPAKILAVSDNYDEMNPVYTVKGAFNLRNAVLLRDDYAYELFNTDDVIGETFILNGEPHSISGIFRLPQLISGISSEMPDIIASIENPALGIDEIQLFQAVIVSSADRAAVESLIDKNSCLSLSLDRRRLLFCQLRKILYMLTALLIVIPLLRMLKNDLLSRRNLFREMIRKYYPLKTLAIVIKYKPVFFLLPVAGLILLTVAFGFLPYLPPGFLSFDSFKDIFFRPLRFILSLNDDINPAILLPSLYEASAFLIICMLFIPGYIGFSMTKNFSIKDFLFIPLLNIAFTLLALLLEVEPVFDLKINLLLILYMLVDAVSNTMLPSVKSAL